MFAPGLPVVFTHPTGESFPIINRRDEEERCPRFGALRDQRATIVGFGHCSRAEDPLDIDFPGARRAIDADVTLSLGRGFCPVDEVQLAILGHQRGQPGMYVELIVVLAILVALAGIVVPRLVFTTENARVTTARTSSVEVRDAVLQYWNDCKYDIDALSANRRIQLIDLFRPRVGFQVFNSEVPESDLGWKGAYLEQTGTYTVTGTTAADFTTAYGQDGDPAVLDPWHRPLVIQEVDPSVRVGYSRDVRIVSAGPDGVFDIDESTPSQLLLSGAVDPGDDVYVTITLR